MAQDNGNLLQVIVVAFIYHEFMVNVPYNLEYTTKTFVELPLDIFSLRNSFSLFSLKNLLPIESISIQTIKANSIFQ